MKVLKFTSRQDMKTAHNNSYLLDRTKSLFEKIQIQFLESGAGKSLREVGAVN
jgi:hypothetical protein